MKQHHLKQVSIAVGLCLAFALGVALQSVMPFARSTQAQGIVVDGNVTRSDPAAPAAPAGNYSRVTYQGRLTTISGTPINGPVSATFKLYDSSNSAIYTATRTITPTNGLFTVYLGDGDDLDLFYSTLSNAASIGVKVGVDSEMTPRQELNTVVGHSVAGAGVVGASSTSDGVHGFSSTGYGVRGVTNNIFGTGVLAQGAADIGIALRILTGGIQVAGAGISTTTPVFVHVANAANITATNQTIISHPLTNGDSNAILIITPVNNYSNVGSVNNAHPVGVFWRADINRWVIYNIDNAIMLPNTRFNVLVVKP